MKKLVSIVLLSALPAISFAWWGDQRVSQYKGSQASVETAGAEHEMYGEDFTRFKTLGLTGSVHTYTVTVSDYATLPVAPGSGLPSTNKYKKYW
jgi:hypothetical protein